MLLLHKEARKDIFKLIFHEAYSVSSGDKFKMISVTQCANHIIVRKKKHVSVISIRMCAEWIYLGLELQSLVANAMELKMLLREEMRQNQSQYKFIHNLALLLNILYCEEMHFPRDSSK